MSSPRFGFLVTISILALMHCILAHGEGIGVGIIAGNPTGVSAKKWLTNNTAIDAAAAWSFNDRGAFQLHANYLWHRDIPAISQHIYGRLPFYVGLGGRVTFDEGNGKHGGNNRAGVRVPLGVTYLFENAPLDLFIEVVPVLDVAPQTDFGLDAAAGIRFYFR